MTPPLSDRVDELLARLFARGALSPSGVYTTEDDPSVIAAAVDRLRVLGYQSIEVDGCTITVRT